MVDRYQELGFIYEKENASSCIMHHDSAARIAWDMTTLALLLYIVFSLPLSLAFGDKVGLQVPDMITDCLFMLDVVLNFRTTYMNQNKERVVLHGKSWELVSVMGAGFAQVLTQSQPTRVGLSQLTSVYFKYLVPSVWS